MSRCVQTLELVTPPAEMPVSIAELRLHCELGETTENDARLEACLAAATAAVEGMLDGRVLLRQQWRLVLDDLPGCGWIALPRRPVLSVDSFRYVDAQGQWQDVSADDYRVDNSTPPLVRATLHGAGWPSTYGEWASVELLWTAGYPFAEQVPEQAKHAVKLLAAHFYEQREPVVVGSTSTIVAEVPMTVKFLIDQLRVLRA